MVYKCFVTSCKSYKSPKNTTFGIPKDPELRRKWEIALRPFCNGKILQEKHRVCKAHFNPEEIEFYFVHLIQGTEVKIERGRPELKKGAVPSVFPGARKSAWQRVLDQKRAEQEKNKQSILLLNGEWVHIKEPEKPVNPPTKPKRRTKTKSSGAAAKLKSDSTESSKQNSFPGNLNEASEYVLLLPGEDMNSSGSMEFPEHVTGYNSSEFQSSQGFLPMKPSDKEIPSICINWDALPLPEELGALLCDTVVPPISSSSDFNVKISHTPSRPLSPKPVLTTLKPPTYLQENFLTEQPPEENLSIPDLDNIAEDEQEEEENVFLTFQGLKSGMSHVPLPSSMWASHTDDVRVFFSFMSYGSTGCLVVPKVVKIVMYQGPMIPRVFLRGIEVTLPVSEEKSTSLEDVEKVLYYVDKLKLCLGIDCAGDVVSYTPDCDIFAESGRLPRCQSCKKQRTVERNRKRHLENDDSKTSFSRPTKKKQYSSK